MSSDTPITDAEKRKPENAGRVNDVLPADFARTLERKNAALLNWKREQLEVEAGWSAQDVGKEIGLPLGAKIREAILPWIIAIKAENAALRASLADAEKERGEALKRDVNAVLVNIKIAEENLALKTQLATANQSLDEAKAALELSINTVECASLDKDKTPLPWYRAAKRVLNS